MPPPRSRSNASNGEDTNENVSLMDAFNKQQPQEGDALRVISLRDRKPKNYTNDDDDDDDGMDVDQEMDASASNPGSVGDSDDNDDHSETEDDDDDDDEEEPSSSLRRSGRARRPATFMNMSNTRTVEGNRGTVAVRQNNSRNTSTKHATNEKGTRTSSRSNKFTSSMAEPTTSIRDLYQQPSDSLLVAFAGKTNKTNRNQSRKQQSERELVDTSEEEEDESNSHNDQVLLQRKRQARGGGSRNSPTKSPARRHTAQRRRSLKQEIRSSQESTESSEESSATHKETESETEEDEMDDEEEEEPLKIQRIIASKTETKAKWKEICKNMNTSEVNYGSRWYQKSHEEDQSLYEERFLVKWSDLSFLHVSWETQNDLVEQCDGAKACLTTFFRKSHNGLLYGADERCDGDYFDPAYTQIERILQVSLPEEYSHVRLTAESEDELDDKAFGMILDKADPDFDTGTGRQFLIKWAHLPYSESTYEFERDLIVNDIEYKEQLRSFLLRSVKSTPSKRKAYLDAGEAEYKRLYRFFGDKFTGGNEETREKAVEDYKRQLQETMYPNGGQLRDYQAEGVAWMISNFVNKRSCILADEMGLGKTLQTAAAVNLLATRLNRGYPVLIIAPLSTLTHWLREFQSWTSLNAVIYHGSAEDRTLVREHEFVYECDRPTGKIGFNQSFLKKCINKKTRRDNAPWMVDVVITTPEMMICDDSSELSVIPWEVLVVDEAHRLKNHNSKLAVCLRNEKFSFRHRMLLTGTPIQNDVQEFWTLLNFIDPKKFDDPIAFNQKYGDMKSKERIDELHEEIRPYILRRLKEDVEHSVPPKEETLIEVELTIDQKKYYRAIYEKNVKFLHKGKKKALDGPSLNNLAMQLRKCCNHLFLLNGIEEEVRKREENRGLNEGDLLAKTSGKLILLDKLLPRLKEAGSRILIFSQFKIMLDILEDYLHARSMKFERIDGSITGHKRQQAIDRFQNASIDGKEAPFIMLLSTRAGGVGITLTAADTCIIFDSDWNPQNDLQAQSRCHRIGQTKNVKVYRLLTRKTYEMQMFHMSSLKMGLDQAVLKGFETGSSGEGSLTKEEVERLLRHGAYDIFNEDKAGDSEAASNAFVQQDIDSILQGRARTVVHENTGSSNAAGGFFSKASFKSKTPDSGKNLSDDVDIEDPDFWKKMIGDVEDDEVVDLGRRQRKHANYNEHEYKRQLEAMLVPSDGESDRSDDSSDDESGDNFAPRERIRWGGDKPYEWKKEDVENLIKCLLAYGYGRLPWDVFLKRLEATKDYDIVDLKKMSWSVILTTIVETAEEEAETNRRREIKEKEKAREEEIRGKINGGGVLAVDRSQDQHTQNMEELKQKAFLKIWESNSRWIQDLLIDAVAYAKDNAPRNQAVIDRANNIADTASKQIQNKADSDSLVAASVWPSLKSRGWKAEMVTDGEFAGRTKFSKNGKEYLSLESVLRDALLLYPELQNLIESALNAIATNKQQSLESQEKERETDFAICKASSLHDIRSFVNRYGSIQLIHDRTKTTRIRLPRKILSHCLLLWNASFLVREAKTAAGCEGDSIGQLASSFLIDRRQALPHDLWTERHDAVLVHAIEKHGWIDHDACAAEIAGDPSIRWGTPFDGVDTNVEVDIAEQSQQESTRIYETAERVAVFFNANREMIEELKSFNSHLVQRAYGLVATSENDSPFRWKVKRELLQFPSITKNSGELVDFPSRKDLAKRAKFLLSRTLWSPTDTSLQKESSATSHGFSVLDQRDAANFFLAELLRALLKEPTQSKHRKRLCAQAAAEARRLADPSFVPLSDKASSKMLTEMRRIVEHIDLVKWNLAGGTTQYKNVLRVILGEEPQKPRKSSEALFPSKRSFPSALQTNSNAATASTVEDSLNKDNFAQNHSAFEPTDKTTAEKAIQKDSSARNNSAFEPAVKTTAEKAIQKARKRLAEHNSNSFNGTLHNGILQLTEIETLILETCCTVGIPVWKSDWRSLIRESKSSDGPNQLTWETLGKHVVSVGQALRDEALENVVQSNVNTGSSEDDNRVHILRSKESSLSQAKEYACEPEVLAKKVIMLLAAVCKENEPIHSQLSSSCDHEIGSGIVKRFRQEINHWAVSLDLLDNYGRALAFTAIDFLDDIPLSQRCTVDISALLYTTGARIVAKQVALLWTIRQFYSMHSSCNLSATIAKAVHHIDNGQSWEKQPADWSLAHDVVLIHRLVDFGLTKQIMETTNSYGETEGSASMPYMNLFSTHCRSELLFRAIQLARYLGSSDDEATETIHKSHHDSDSGKLMNGHSSPSSLVLIPKNTNTSTSYEQQNSTPTVDDVCELYYSDVEIISPPKRKVSGGSGEGSDKKSRLS